MNNQITVNHKVYPLSLDNCEAFFNDEEAPIHELDAALALKWIGQMPQESFALEYYEDDCESCPPAPRSKKRLVPFIEGHFYLFTKAQTVVMTNIDADYQQGAFDGLLADSKADDSYILSLVLCPKCHKFQIEVERCEM